MPRSLPNLIVSRRSASARISARVRAGKDFLTRRPRSHESLAKLMAETDQWSYENTITLAEIVDTNTYSDEYEQVVISNRRKVGRKDISAELEQFRNEVQREIDKLEDIRERVKGLQESHQSNKEAVSPPSSSRVFVVHGHDDLARLAVSNVLRKLRLNPIVLADEVSSGRTIIEKFEQSSDVGFAVVLLTPDDRGGPVSDPSRLSPRARQNVIFELGYFVGKLGRKHVCALYKGEMELPSDYNGVVYVRMDDGDGWHMRIAREMKAAGLAVDLNLL
jgi:predicted nucleotide-binding protein